MKIPENFTPQELYAAAWNAAIGDFTLELKRELILRIKELQTCRAAHLNITDYYDDICHNYTKQIEMLRGFSAAMEVLGDSYHKNAEDFE